MISNHGNTVQKFSEIKGYCFLISVSETHLQRKQSYSLKNSKNICTYHANTESVGHLAGKKKQQREKSEISSFENCTGFVHRSWKTWKVVEFMISISRPGKSWNSSEGHGNVMEK